MVRGEIDDCILVCVQPVASIRTPWVTPIAILYGCMAILLHSSGRLHYLEGRLGVVEVVGVGVVEAAWNHDKFVCLCNVVAEVGLGFLGVRAVRLF